MSVIRSTPKWVRDLQFWFRRMGARVPNRTFSNFGEQQIIDKYIERFSIQNDRSVVDIGAGDGIRSSNTFHLFSNGWTGVGIEADPAKYERLKQTYGTFAGVAAVSSLVSPENIAELLSSHAIEHEFGVLSLDIDGNDYWVLDAVLARYRPGLVVSEYNEKIPPPIKFTVDFDPAFELRHHFFGYSIAKLEDLLAKYEYELLEVEYNNVFFAPREIARGSGKPASDAYNEGYRDRPDRREKFPMNANMEVLFSLAPSESVEFLDDFYSDHRGKYQISLEQAEGQ